jgi:MinD-like ATPase involved in chromosome partitioning or flagellar assembly
MSERSESIRVLVAARDRAVRDHLRRVLTSTKDCIVTGVAVDGQEAVHMAGVRKHDVAVVMLDLPIYNGLETTRMIRQYVPAVKGILIGNGDVSPDMTKQAMLAGASACLSSTEIDSALLSTIKDIYDPPMPPLAPPCNIIAVTGGRGGIGKSTVASGLALCLHQKFPGQVVLLDMYTQFGDISTMLRIEDPRPLVELQAEKIDLELLQSYMSDHQSGLKVLIGSIVISPLDALGGDLLENIIHELKKGYRFVLIDLPPLMHEPVLRVISLIHELIIVTNRFEVQTVTDAKRLLDTVAPRYIPLEQVKLVVNRVSRHDSISQDQIEKAVGVKIQAMLPNQRNLAGDPMRGNTKLANALHQLANILAEEPSQLMPDSGQE